MVKNILVIVMFMAIGVNAFSQAANQPSEIEIFNNDATVEEGCTDGSLEVIVNSGGEPPYNIRWMSVDALGAEKVISYDSKVDGLPEGNYKLHIEDSKCRFSIQEVELECVEMIRDYDNKDDNESEFSEDALKSNIFIYPNPTDGIVYLKASDFKSEKTYSLNILNSQNSLLATSSIDSQSSKFDLSGYPSGLYFFVVTTDEGVKLVEKVSKF